MKLIYAIAACVLLLFLFQASSCTRYIDKVIGQRKEPVMQGSITFYPDSNILIYRSNVGVRMDTVVSKPKPFHVKLPKGLVWSSIANSQSFVFYYPHNQAIAIYIDLAFSASKNDTTYEPTETEIIHLVNSSTLGYDKKYDIRKIEFNPRRKQVIMKKDGATILLYNITSEKATKFCEYLKEFKFL